MKFSFTIIFLIQNIFIFSQKGLEYSGGKGNFAFSKPFKSIKDIPRFSEWDSLPNGKWTQSYSDGKVALIYTMKNHLLNGPVTGYYPSGAKRFEFAMYGNYINGDYKEYHENGQLWKHYQYFEGFMHGKWYMYYDTGIKQAEGYSQNNKSEGKLYHWWPNGNMKEERTYKNDTVWGMTIFWYENGTKKMEGVQHIYDHPVGDWTFWFENGQVWKKSFFENNIEKVYFAYDRQGKPLVENGNGIYVEWNLFQKRLKEGPYKDGYQDGKWYTWDENNINMSPRESYYKKGIKQ